MGRTFLKDGRKWNVNVNGINNLTKTYVIQLDTNNLGENAEIENFQLYGIPPIGSQHPLYSYLIVDSYSIEEGEASEKKLIKVTVNYVIDDTVISGGSLDDDEAVEQWGWDVGVEQKEVIYNLWDQKEGPLLNSAGDVFDNVPVCDFPAPIFTKIIKTKDRKNWLDLNCTLNKNSISIGSMSCPQKSLLASISEQRIFGDSNWKYRYTIQLRYKTNLSNLGAGTNPIDFGWDIPVIDCGMREKGIDGKLKTIMQVDQETGKPCAVTSAELLDGDGKAVSRAEGNTPNPYIIRVQAYKTETFPSAFYSEPI